MAAGPRKKRPRRERRKRVAPPESVEPTPAETERGSSAAEAVVPEVDERLAHMPAVGREPSPVQEPEASAELIQLDLEPEAEPEEETGEPEGEKKGFRRGMSRSRRLLSRPFTRAATRKVIDADFWNEAEDAFIAADTGVDCAVQIVERSRARILSEGTRDVEGLKQAFRAEVAEMLCSLGSPPDPPPQRPRVLFVVGVNGVGKTTTAAKMGFQLKRQGMKVLFAAADTFRAAGIEQMEMWAGRVGAPIVRHRTGGDPAAVVFDAIESAQAKGIDVVIVDTAGRLHTKKNLMEELRKMWRVAERQLEAGPEAILVIDATTGQNGVNQARIFGEAIDIGSIALTKMDGSAKGGVVMAIGREMGIPVSYVGLGEGMGDLRPFDPDEYARALF
jgi:fused signal recognition particle receptor